MNKVDEGRQNDRMIEELRERIRFLEEENEKNKDLKVRFGKILTDLRERVKELNCLYSISKLVEKDDFGSYDAFRKIIDIMRQSWQFPETTCVRLVIDYQEYTTKKFRETMWQQLADIFVSNDKRGSIEVFYTERHPDCDEGPFLKEERNLLNAVAEVLGKIIERKDAELQILALQKELVQKTTNLEQTNTALNIMLKNREEEIRRNENMIALHVNTVIIPYLQKVLTTGSRDVLATYVSLIEKNLAELSKTHITHYPDLYLHLTPTEMKITDLIVENKSTTEIATLLHLSDSTVNFHRKNIRRKLGLANKRTNLRTYLQGLFAE